MSGGIGWTRQQLLVAFGLYCQIPFGQFHSRNPEIMKYSNLIGRTPSALAMKLSNIASLDPEITSTGRSGLKGASIADRSMWEEMHLDWEGFSVEMYKSMKDIGAEKELDSDSAIKKSVDESSDYTGENRTVQTTARIGQQFFRKAVLSAYDEKCCITGLSLPRLLVASHIVPWRKDKENRLNPSNGLCLSMLHDKAFDIGIITIAEDMTVRVTRKQLIRGDEFYVDTLLNYEGKPISLPDKFQPNIDFLAYHREQIFEH